MMIMMMMIIIMLPYHHRHHHHLLTFRFSIRERSACTREILFVASSVRS
jgi:hypothetical protein